MENLEDVKTAAIDRARQLASIKLSESDYKVIRQTEQGTLSEADFAALKAERQAVRDDCNALQARVAECNTVEAVYALVPPRP